jgi:uncharacterized delta-60 repeat protein
MGRVAVLRNKVLWCLALLSTAAVVALAPSGGAADDPAAIFVHAVAVQDDGKIVAAGQSNAGGLVDFAVLRFNSDGSPDTGFGDGGRVVTDLGTDQDVANDVAIQRDGKIVAVGSAMALGSSSIALARYETDGTLDTSFGSNGRVTTSLGGSVDQASGVVVQDDGKLVVAGSHDVLGGQYLQAVLARYDIDGALDSSLDGDGIVTTPLGFAAATSVALQRDGKIVAAGFSGHLQAGEFAVWRYNADGSVDAGFGSDGVVLTQFAPGDFQSASAVAIQKNGRIVVAGLREDESFNTDLALARYTRDGALDDHFGTGGKVTADFGGRESIGDIALQRNGRIVASATERLIQYDSDGHLDGNFGDHGVVSNVTPGALAIQRDWKIVSATGAEIARYNRDGSPDTGFGDSGKVTIG